MNAEEEARLVRQAWYLGAAEALLKEAKHVAKGDTIPGMAAGWRAAVDKWLAASDADFPPVPERKTKDQVCGYAHTVQRGGDTARVLPV